MRVNAGYDAADFILNLSRQPSTCVYDLDWGEVHNFYMRGWGEGATPSEHFEALFSSPAGPRDVILRNPNLSDEQIRKLAARWRETLRSGEDSQLSLRVFRYSYGLSIESRGDGFWCETEPSGRWRNSLGSEGDN
jgi:hypothetical protein